MFSKALMLGIYAETPLHPGSGVSINRPIDLPIQRERHTDFPYIQASSLKGVLRRFAEILKENGRPVFNKIEIDDIFGPVDSSKAGVLSVTDARLLAFPVRSLVGVFGWVTCPLVLDRFSRDLSMLGIPTDWKIEEISKNQTLAPQETNLAFRNDQVIVEDVRLTMPEKKEPDNLKKITDAIMMCIPTDSAYEHLHDKMSKDTILVHDDLFKELTSLTTEVVSRIRIDKEKGTAAEGALWYEEQIPADTLLYCTLFISNRYPEPDKLVEKLVYLDGSIVQIGGDETIGRGFARLKMVGKDAKKS